VRQQAPGTPTTDYVEDGLEDLAQSMHSGASRGFGGRNMGFYARPIGVGEVCLICSSHARCSTEPLSQVPFSDGFGR
jgi:hypothetical protein